MTVELEVLLAAVARDDTPADALPRVLRVTAEPFAP